MSFRNPKMPKYAATHFEMTKKTKNIVRNVQLKWMNLSKIRQDKNISDKKCNLSLRLVLFCSPSAVFLIGPLQLSLSTVKRTKLYRSNVRDVFNFLQEKLHFMVFSRWISVEQLAKRGCFKLHEPWKVGILIGRIIFLKLEKTSFACGQFNKTFTGVIHKCSYCFQTLGQWLHL